MTAEEWAQAALKGERRFYEEYGDLSWPSVIAAVAAAIRAAIAEEREACARIADEHDACIVDGCEIPNTKRGHVGRIIRARKEGT